MIKTYAKFITAFIIAILVTVSVASEGAAEKHSQYVDVTDRYSEAVEFVLSKGGSGLTNDLYGIPENIKRVDAAILLAKVLELDTENAPTSGLTDVPERGVKYINALKAAGVISGKTATTLDSNAQITRGELAIWLQRGFNLSGEVDVKFKDVGERYDVAVGALVSSNVTFGLTETTFGTTENATRGQFALFLKRAHDAVKAVEPEVPEVVEIF